MDEPKSYLKIYVGTPTEDGEDFLYLDLVIPKRTTLLWQSKDSLNDCSGADYLSLLERAFNEATLFSKALGLKIRVETEMIVSVANDFGETDANSVRRLLHDMR